MAISIFYKNIFNPDSTKNRVDYKQEAEKLLAQVLQEKPNSAYAITIPLLGTSFLGDADLARKLENQFLESYGISLVDSAKDICEKIPNRTEAAWLFGRVLVSAQARGDEATALKASEIIEALLEDQKNDCFAAWAWGYLAMYDSSYIGKMLDSIEDLSLVKEEEGKDNVPWAIVMGLQSLSAVKDSEDYEKCLKKLQDFTHRTSVVEALETIPAGDFRAWAMSFILLAARRMGDNSTYQQLRHVLDKEIQSSSSSGDQMLAYINLNLSVSS